MIRKAEQRDFDILVELGTEFAVKTQGVHTLKINIEKVWKLVQAAIYEPEVVCLVAEVEGVVCGFIFGGVTNSYFSDEKVLQELALYSRRATSLYHLIDGFIAEAHRREISKILVGSKPAFCDLGPIYFRRGFKVLEVQYLRREG